MIIKIQKAKHKTWKFYTLGLLLVGVLSVWVWFDPARFLVGQQQKNDALIAEQMAHHVGVVAYLYGYPVVDMLSQMHNETQRVSKDQFVYAPVNRYFIYPGLVTPSSGGNLRSPNADTLYFSAWFDITNGPLIIATPDTAGRYFTIAVTNLYSEVIHIGRRTTGTKARRFALITPDWQGELPEGVEKLVVETSKGWLLGRMYVAGEHDLAAADALVREMQLTALNEPVAMNTSDVLVVPTELTRLEPYSDLSYFEILDSALRSLPPRAGEEALMAMFRQVGIGGEAPFSASGLDDATRRGLERAIEDGKALVDASTKRTISDINGWMISDSIGRYGFNYLHRASVAAGGYGNLPEESLYPAAVFDQQGQLLSGEHKYRITFAPNALPPVNGFWSITAYDLWHRQLIPSNLGRFNIGDRTPGLNYNDDGSLTLYLQVQPPIQGTQNWLPLPEGHFLLVMRLYEPMPEALSFAWQPPSIVKIE